MASKIHTPDPTKVDTWLVPGAVCKCGGPVRTSGVVCWCAMASGECPVKNRPWRIAEDKGKNKS